MAMLGMVWMMFRTGSATPARPAERWQATPSGSPDQRPPRHERAESQFDVPCAVLPETVGMGRVFLHYRKAAPGPGAEDRPDDHGRCRKRRDPCGGPEFELGHGVRDEKSEGERQHPESGRRPDPRQRIAGGRDMRGDKSDHHEDADQRRGAAGEPETGARAQERDERAGEDQSGASALQLSQAGLRKGRAPFRKRCGWAQRRKRLEDERDRDNRRDRRAKLVETHGGKGFGDECPVRRARSRPRRVTSFRKPLRLEIVGGHILGRFAVDLDAPVERLQGFQVKAREHRLQERRRSRDAPSAPLRGRSGPARRRAERPCRRRARRDRPRRSRRPCRKPSRR